MAQREKMLALTRIQQQEAFRKYCFEEYSRPDYLSRAVVLLVDSNFIIRAVRFNSSAYGIAAYSFGRGLTESSAWEDESASRALSATSNYYPAAGLSHQPAIVAKVVEDTLKAAPPGIFGLMVERFITDTNAEIKYEYFHFKLAPVKTTGQIRVFHYEKQEKPAPASGALDEPKNPFPGLLRHLNPLYIGREVVHSILDAIDNIRYRCPHCGTDNRLLAQRCKVCHSARPRLTFRVAALFFVRALIDMTYFFYVFAALTVMFYALCMGKRLHNSIGD